MIHLKDKLKFEKVLSTCHFANKCGIPKNASQFHKPLRVEIFIKNFKFAVEILSA